MYHSAKRASYRFIRTLPTLRNRHLHSELHFRSGSGLGFHVAFQQVSGTVQRPTRVQWGAEAAKQDAVYPRSHRRLEPCRPAAPTVHCLQFRNVLGCRRRVGRLGRPRDKRRIEYHKRLANHRRVLKSSAAICGTHALALSGRRGVPIAKAFAARRTNPAR